MTAAPTMTTKDRRAVYLTARGEEYDVIAEALGCTNGAARKRLLYLREKFAAKSNAHLVAILIGNGILDARVATGKPVYPRAEADRVSAELDRIGREMDTA